MRAWPEARRLLLFAVAAAMLYTAWVFGSRYMLDKRWRASLAPPPAESTPEFDRVYGGSALKIIQFYAREGNLKEGEQSVICYGVLNAKSVRIDPPVDGVFPALNRCVAVSPEHDTRYTLTAEGADGKTVSASFVLAVSADAAALPKVTHFNIANRQKDYRGRTVFSLTFGATNADTVDIDPPVFSTLHGAPNGNFYVAPEKSTTYTLTVKNKRGHKASRQLTVEVPKI